MKNRHFFVANSSSSSFITVQQLPDEVKDKVKWIEKLKFLSITTMNVSPFLDTEEIEKYTGHTYDSSVVNRLKKRVKETDDKFIVIYSFSFDGDDDLRHSKEIDEDLIFEIFEDEEAFDEDADF